MRINKVYTRTGDRGETHLIGGKRASKDSLRIEAYGTVDELNSAMGLARAFVQTSKNQTGALVKLDQMLRNLQEELFDLGSELATPPDSLTAGGFQIGPEQVRKLEELIDDCQRDLEPLDSFVLPGGGCASAALHQARTICRRAERLAVKLSREEQLRGELLSYLNRLSDLLFVLARWTAKQLGEKEQLWQRPLKKKL